MRRVSLRGAGLAVLLASLLAATGAAQRAGAFDYIRHDEEIAMRDGVKLHTVIMAPRTTTTPLPILLLRTPYGADDDATPFPSEYLRTLAQDGYIFAFQDIRGQHKSQGTFVMNRPFMNGKGLDETTDTYDTIEWLLKNQRNNNGRVGALGISYPGWLTEMVGMTPHPAVKAVSPQAPMTDTWMGDDFFHQGAFRMSYGLEYAYAVESSKDGAEFNVGAYDMYDWYLRQGTLEDITNAMGSKLPSWRTFVDHPAYDAFWQAKAVERLWTKTEVPTLHVGGFWDQEDMFGPMAAYKALEPADAAAFNRVVLGPWNHGQWSFGDGGALDLITFGGAPGRHFRDKIQAPFFAFYLKDAGSVPVGEATVYESGADVWRTYTAWPPREATPQSIYLQPGGKVSFDAPRSGAAFTSYVSDPAHPVPYRPRPIQPTYCPCGSNWSTWLAADQRFVDGRPDVATWVGDTLSSDVVLAGNVTARLFASTSGTDADWVVKLIDVYPDAVPENPKLGGYELMVSSDIMRGRYRRSFERPEPIVADQVLEYKVDLHQQAHRFLKGHRIMVQVQSTWFPLYDRNPQTFVPNIFHAKVSDFQSATQRIYHSSQFASRIDVDIVK